MSQPAFDFGDDELDDGANPTYTVGELAEAINSSIQRSFGDGIWVRGEITGWSDRGNHAYFTLADDALVGERNGAVINVQFFAPARMRLRPMLQKHRLRLADGMKVRVFGYLDYYAPTGRIGLKMTGIDPKYTLGDIAQSRDEIVRRLVADGLLDANGRRPLSPVPLRIGAVTSVGTAAWHDFRHELESSGLGFQLSVVDVRVQGEFASAHVAAAIGTLARLRRPRRHRRHPRRRARRTNSPCSTPRSSPARSPRARCPYSPGSGTRSTAASPTRWPTPR